MLWHVTYDDGDEEELELEELLFAMDFFDCSQEEKKEGTADAIQESAAATSAVKTKKYADENNIILKHGKQNQFTIPIIIAAVAIIVWLCQQILFTNAVNQEDLLRSTTLLKFQPDKFQGANKKKRYFEGWYYKFVSPTLLDTSNSNNNHTSIAGDNNGSVMSMAVVPGIFYSQSPNSNESHAFIFVTLNGEKQHYYRFDTSEFSYASGKEEYYIQVGNNRFTHAGVSLNLHPGTNDDADLILKGDLSFTNPSPWPVSLTKLNAMGYFGWIPGLECTHGILSFDHVLHGSLSVSSASETSEVDRVPTSISFDQGRGYTEKDFGRSFPSLWVWIQSNSFRNNPGTSLFVSIARVPVFGLELPGFTAAIWHNETLIPFATWSGAKFEDIQISKEEVHIAMKSSNRKRTRSNDYRVEITVDRRNVPEVLLYAPVNFTKMAPFVWEALQARVHMRLFRGNDLLIDDVGEYAGLEVHGNVQWLVDNVCGKESASKIICL